MIVSDLQLWSMDGYLSGLRKKTPDVILVFLIGSFRSKCMWSGEKSTFFIKFFSNVNGTFQNWAILRMKQKPILLSFILLMKFWYKHTGISAEPTTIQQVTELPHYPKDMKWVILDCMTVMWYISMLGQHYNYLVYLCVCVAVYTLLITLLLVQTCYIYTYMTEFLIHFEVWAKLAKQWLVCVSLEIHL